MTTSAEQAAAVLVKFARLAAAKGTSGILPILAESAVEQLHADAAAVLQLDERGRAKVAASRNLPPGLGVWEVEAETIGPELGAALLAACQGGFASVDTLPLVSGGGLYGVLVLLSRSEGRFAGEQRALAEGLADLAAVVIHQAVQLDRLERSLAELRAARETLERTEKLRALGQMAAGVSHDLKNVLNPISLQVQLLRRRIHADSTAVESVLAQLDDAVRHGVATVERLRDFSRQAPERAAEPTDLNRAVASALELCGPRLRQHDRLSLAEQLGAPPEIEVRREDLVNAIVNLLVNAVEACPSGARVVVRTGADGGGGFVEVEDDGPGMPPEIESRVFEPFFTTKSEGSGLGLAMVYAFLQRHHGKLQLETAPGEGTRLRLWFPGRKG